MSDQLHERLNARIEELRAAGRTVARIEACPASIEQLFVEVGQGAILLDCDPARDAAWYGDVELHACPTPGARLLVTGEDGSQIIEI
jgi:hypothetical protein